MKDKNVAFEFVFTMKKIKLEVNKIKCEIKSNKKYIFYFYFNKIVRESEDRVRVKSGERKQCNLL